MAGQQLVPKSSINFQCKACASGLPHFFEAAPTEVIDAPDQEHHPYNYFAPCPSCGSLAGQVQWEKNLFKAWARSTGPKTPEGKAAVTKNIEGHPTPEEALRTRFNAMKHGLFARTATYFPAKPGQYPQCEGCELRETVCPEQVACLKKTELFMKHQIAFETQDPKMLTLLRSDMQSAVTAMINDMIYTIMLDGGVRVRSPEWYYDKDGGFHLAKYTDDETGQQVQIFKLEEHPLVKRVMEFIQKNAMTLADMEMTPKTKDEADSIRGFLDDTKQKTGDAVEYQKQIASGMNDIRDMIRASQEKTKRDPVLIEHGAQDQE